ncbi:hypothetical protein [uncultured Thiodictyon sp.]|uniref:hypothetical protein n=1 Tax=uncultured Thiodictyon sp. TaxID=1846217 RepID=UPI0025FA02D3|nr:hypothetical protein [uncultured Thiodictyon sp.]
MSIQKQPLDEAPPDVGAAVNPAALAVSPQRIDKSREIGCVFAGLVVRVAERSPDDYAAFLEDL